ncbi:hypothetical protein GALMADRAFT_57320, partial [Galerina marginata CBS 339.88]
IKMTAPFTEASLKKLTVPQLKVLCKEKRLTGYSKLPKDPIIARLLEWQTKQVSSPASSREGYVLEGSLEIPATQTSHLRSITVPCSQLQPPQVDVSRIIAPDVPHEATIGCATTDNESRPAKGTRDTAVLLKRPRRDSETLPSSYPQTKKTRINVPLIAGYSATVPIHTRQLQATPALPVQASKSPIPDVEEKEKTSINDSGQGFNFPIKPQPLAQPAKFVQRRFKALIPAKNCGPGSPLTGVPSVTRYLDFPPEEQISLKTISLPPSLAQRKHVPTLSLILSGISLQDLKACALVSRSFRYSAYLSASRQLSRRFPGARLRDVLQRYPQKIINLWPYLHYRDQEVQTRKNFYETSFLFKTCKGLFEVDEHLWKSPDHERQANVAIRFLITRLFFLVSIGGDEYKRTEGTGVVISAEEVVGGEVWKIRYRSSSSIQTFYVLESTCEVIGNAEIPLHASTPSPTGLRADWWAYIQHKIGLQPQTNNGQHGGLSECIQWSNHEEYDVGISRLWLKRIEREGDSGVAKLTIARRYVFACVISNSISGSWRSSNEMAQDFDGRPLTYAPTREPTAKAQRINLFIPAHHHVESVHFTSSDGRCLHPAIAVVQTPGREYFILRDNGMQVGCEEEGIASVWMEILGCNQNGCVHP